MARPLPEIKCRHTDWPMALRFLVECTDGRVVIELCDCCADSLAGRIFQKALNEAIKSVPWSAWKSRRK